MFDMSGLTRPARTCPLDGGVIREAQCERGAGENAGASPSFFSPECPKFYVYSGRFPSRNTHTYCVIDDLGLHGVSTNRTDRKSTRLNSSQANISYAVSCLKKK